MPAKPNINLAKLLFRAVMYGVIAWLLGFGLYYIRLPKPPETLPKADAIVVLTGGAGRIETGIMLLEKSAAPHMLISGVNPSVVAHELPASTGTDPKWFACCIDLGYTAGSTYGNASETQDWVAENNYSSLILVTENYHMPRSAALFRRAMPDIQITAYPVVADASPARLAKEYSKYLVILVRDMTSL